jgi:predicted nucleic acid-binding protein
MKKYYFDTSIWLDFFENRDEPNLPKGEWANKLINKIVKNDDRIIYSDNNVYELNIVGYSSEDIKNMLKPIKPILIFVESTEKQIGKAKDLALKRDIPKRDALHALIARDNKAILVTLDKHFQKLLDIIKPKSPKELI